MNKQKLLLCASWICYFRAVGPLQSCSLTHIATGTRLTNHTKVPGPTAIHSCIYLNPPHMTALYIPFLPPSV